MVAVLITGATGRQGGSLIRNLIAREASLEILAITRRKHSISARKLSQLSSQIKLVEGNLDDPATLFENAQKAAASPIWGVFSVQVSMQMGGRTERQESLVLKVPRRLLPWGTTNWRRRRGKR